MAFNADLMKPSEDTDAARIAGDAQRIEALGGPAAVARRLDFDAKNGTQRVQNWLTRGIPAAVKLLHPELFLVEQPRPKRQQRVANAKAG